MRAVRSVQRRAKGGKTFRLTAVLEDGIVDKITLTGDFFIVPEEGLEVVEMALLDSARHGCSGTAERLREAAGSQGVRLSGLSFEDLEEALRETIG